ncbi:MAG: histidine phosphatase family protein [Clostridia bacterium]|jgi:probable phosphoglycerate mutase|nr:histidine phosphatase family protein [Clostridia bacterium]
MNKTKLYIIRHAETIGNIEHRLTGRKDYELTRKGIETTKILDKELKNVKFDIAYSSTSARTLKTIQEVANRNGLAIKMLEDLCEMYFGIYDGEKWDDVNKINPRIKQRQNEVNLIEGIENQETMEQVAERMYKCISDICEENIGKTIIICSHGVAIEAFLRKIKDIPFCQQREKFCQHNTAINELEYENGEFYILRLADVDYISKRMDFER